MACPLENDPHAGSIANYHLLPFLLLSIHGNLYVTLMHAFCRRYATKLRQNYNRTLTKLRQSLVDENPKLSNAVTIT